MPYVHIEVSDIINSIGPGDMQEIVDDLYEQGIVPSQLKKYSIPSPTLAITSADADLYLALHKISNNILSLSKDEYESIMNISKGLI